MDAVPHPLVVELVQRLLKRRVKRYTHAEKKTLAKKLTDPANVDDVKAIQAASESAAGRKKLGTR